MNNILLNPGPTNTLSVVKAVQTDYSDVCHRTDEFAKVLNEVKFFLLNRFSMQATLKDWNVSVFGGSGTTAMEALISSLLSKTNIIISGKYGQRASDMMSIYNINSYAHFAETSNDLQNIILNNNSKNLFFVENETTTGEKFSLEKITKTFPKHRLYIDATSAFGATSYDDYIEHIDAISFCSNKCLQSTPGLGIVIWRNSLQTHHRSYYLDLQKYIADKLPFTLPVQSVAALGCALKESHTNELAMNCRRDSLINDLAKLGIECVNYEPSNTIIGFKHPTKNYEELRGFLKKRNIIIYDGIESIEDSFRIATMSVQFDKQYDYIIGCFNDSCIH